ncbi:unnamed protein product [Prunus armeniaca]
MRPVLWPRLQIYVLSIPCQDLKTHEKIEHGWQCQRQATTLAVASSLRTSDFRLPLEQNIIKWTNFGVIPVGGRT